MDINSALTYATDPNVLAFSTWAGLVIGALGIVLSFYFYLKSNRAKRPYCLTFTHSITRASTVSVQDLQILYRGEPVRNLAMTKVVFWNAGSETVNKLDVPDVTPFRIGVKGTAVLLNHSVEFLKNPSNAVTFVADNTGRGLLVQFDYFDQNDGFVLELLHTAESDESVEVVSTFKGANQLVRRSAAPLLSLPKVLRKLLASEARALIGLILIAAPLFSFADSHFEITPSWWIRNSLPKNVAEWFVLVIALAPFLFAGVYLLRTRLPSGFNLKWD